MIGIFLYSAGPCPNDVQVRLGFGTRGETTGEIVVPDAVQMAMERSNYPLLEHAMSAESALSYGLFLAIRSGNSLIIGGDHQAWDPTWGQLIDAKQSLS